MHKDTLAELLRQECRDFTQRMLSKYRAHTVKFDVAVNLYQEDITVSFTISLPSNAPPKPDLKDDVTATTLPGILSHLRDQADAILNTVPPVHWLVNVDGDPHQVATACGYTSWYSEKPVPVDQYRETIHHVTCPGCLEYLASLADKPIIIEAHT